MDYAQYLEDMMPQNVEETPELGSNEDEPFEAGGSEGEDR